MGGLFSSQADKRKEEERLQAVEQRKAWEEKLKQQSAKWHREELERLRENKLYEEYWKQQKLRKEKSKNANFYGYSPRNLQFTQLIGYNSNVFTLEYLTPNETERVSRVFKKSSQRSMSFKSVLRVNNPFLNALYIMKKDEITKRFRVSGNFERELFHGTKAEYINSICQYNFDYRKCGSSKGHKFGKGVSFSPLSSYASHYCDKSGTECVMLLCKVLVISPEDGDCNTVYPSDGYDTTQNGKGHVLVKYDDNTFYPMYKITFHIDREMRKQEEAFKHMRKFNNQMSDMYIYD